MKRLDYIHSEGLSWIDTKIKCKSTLKIQVKLKFTNTTSCAFGGAVWGSEADTFNMFVVNGTSYLDFGSGANGNRVTGSGIPINQEVFIEVSNRYIKNLSTGSYYINASAVSAWEKAYNLMLAFDCNAYTSHTTQAVHVSLYYVRIYDGNTILFDGFPAKNDDENIGMYDVLTKTFFENAGTSPFTYGQEMGDFGLTAESFYNLAMTSNDYFDNKGNRFIATASSVYDAPRQPYKAFDGIYNVLSEFHPQGGLPQWLKLECPSKVKILEFTMWSRPNYADHPSAFTLQGSMMIRLGMIYNHSLGQKNQYQAHQFTKIVLFLKVHILLMVTDIIDGI